jgi:hypothetical protein
VKVSVEVGTVETCMAAECSYNSREECLAPAVCVGDEHQQCDTYTTASADQMEMQAAVRSCLVNGCAFNRLQSCVATGVTVGGHEHHADCMTFRPR